MSDVWDSLKDAREAGSEIKMDLASLRSSAVRQAWKNEQDLVRSGRGTRQWTVGQQAELLDTGRVTGFEGSHMMNAKDYPEYAGDPDNIQLLPSIAHFEGVHQGSPRAENPNGWFDESTGEIVPAEDGQIPIQEVMTLEDLYDPSQAEYHNFTPLYGQSGQQRHDDYVQSKENHPEKSQKIGFRAPEEEYENEDESEQIAEQSAVSQNESAHSESPVWASVLSSDELDESPNHETEMREGNEMTM